MEPAHKKILKSLTLEMRHLLEGYFTSTGEWIAGDLEQRLRSLGVRRDRDPLPVDEMSQLNDADRAARLVVDAYVATRKEAGVGASAAVAEFIRETAYTWANRLVAIRCMEAREVIDDDVVLTKAVYGGRSLRHHRLVRQSPELERAEDSGLFAALEKAFRDLSERLPLAFDAKAPGIALRPSVATLNTCVALLSGTQSPPGQEPAGDAVFKAPDTLGWAYQYWNTEEKKRVFEAAAGKGPDRKRHKIEGANIVPATQLYTEPYMVKFLVQNSLGALWASMHPDTALAADWEYFIADAERATVLPRSPDTITILDPACGSGHFLLEAFDVLMSIYREADPARTVDSIIVDILTKNLHGIDIDQRAVEIAEIVLWMKAAEQLEFPWEFLCPATNLVATNLRLPKGPDHLEGFLTKHPEDRPLKPALQVVFEGLAHADELGALLLVEEPVEKELRLIKQREDQHGAARTTDPQTRIFRQGEQTALPLSARSFEDWRNDVLGRLQAHFGEEAQASDLVQAFFGKSVERALGLFDLLSLRYDVVAANPPYMTSRNMGIQVQSYLARHYGDAKRDLYTAFIARTSALCVESGRAALVTQHGWMFASGYANLRSNPASGLLRTCYLENIAHLGPHGFEEITGEVVSSVLSIIQASAPAGRLSTAIRLIDLPTPGDKAQALKHREDSRVYLFRQSELVSIPGAPICYWIGLEFQEMLSTWAKVGDIVEVFPGLKTGSDARFLRFFWEVSEQPGWVPYSKGGGGFERWYGQTQYVADWRNGRAPYREYPDSRQPYSESYFRDGMFVYSAAGDGALGVRDFGVSPAIFGSKGPAVFPGSDRWIVGYLNTRCASYLIQSMTVGLDILVENVRALPVRRPELDLQARIESAVTRAVLARRKMAGASLTDRAFDGSKELADLFLAELEQLEAEAEIDEGVRSLLSLTDAQVAEVFGAVGAPVTSYPRAAANGGLLSLIIQALDGQASVDGDDQSRSDADDGADEVSDGSLAPLPANGPLERTSMAVGIHPQTVLSEVLSAMAAGKVVSRKASAEAMVTTVTKLVLQVLGFRWPSQIARGESLPAWADADGVVPLTYLPAEESIGRKIEGMLGESAGGEGTAPALGVSLDLWLGTRFFDSHVRQFKKRPVAWQVQSGAFTPRMSPAFACLLAGQHVTGDTLPLIRSHYVGPGKVRLESERRVLERIDSRSADQALRFDELQTHIHELVRFETVLRGVEESGFYSPELPAIAVQDALQSLVKPLLARFRAELSSKELQWCEEANAIDSGLGAPLTAALDRIPEACARAFAAEASKPTEEPTIRRAVIEAAPRLATFAIHEAVNAWDGAFDAWVRVQRDAAVAAGRKPPKLKHEKDAAMALRLRIRGWTPATTGIPSFVAGLPLFDPVCGEPGRAAASTLEDFVLSESAYRPDVNDGVRVNIAPLQRAGVLAADVLASKDVPGAIADRAAWRADERRWVREGKLPRVGWWPKGVE